MLAVLVGTVFLHFLDLILLIISTSVNAWRTEGQSSYDLWYHCTTDNGGYKCKGASEEEWLQAVQALMILATIFSLLALIFFMSQLFTLTKGGRFFFTAIFQILSSIFVMCGTIIYTVMSPGDNPYGYGFVLAWLAFPLTFISGIIYIILRKK